MSPKHSAAVAAIVLVLMLVSMALFRNCYTEHRDLGFTVPTAIMSCSS